jgi:hypothetical protein
MLPRNITEWIDIRQLPVVAEFVEDGKKTLYLITDHQKFYADIRASCSGNQFYPSYGDMRKLVEKHGKPMTEEEFGHGEALPALFGVTRFASYTEYRFKAPEAEKR